MLVFFLFSSTFVFNVLSYSFPSCSQIIGTVLVVGLLSFTITYSINIY